MTTIAKPAKAAPETVRTVARVVRRTGLPFAFPIECAGGMVPVKEPDNGRLRGEIKATARLAGPPAVAQLTTFMMGVVDIACIGRFSEEALGAVSGNAMLWGVSSMAIGIDLDPLVSQAVGAGDRQRAYRWFIKGNLLTLLVSIPIIGPVSGNQSTAPVRSHPDLTEGAFEYAVYRALPFCFSVVSDIESHRRATR